MLSTTVNESVPPDSVVPVDPSDWTTDSPPGTALLLVTDTVADDSSPPSKPETSTGVEFVRLLVVVPLPNCPRSFMPQHLALPEVVTAQVWVPEVLSVVSMEATPLVSPDTSTGVGLSVVVPLPSCPEEFLPQHLAPPEVVTAQPK